MKNRVIAFLVMSLFIAVPLVNADNFLSGYSILDSANNFFSNFINFFKENIFKKDVVGEQICELDEMKCGTTNECGEGNVCTIKCVSGSDLNAVAIVEEGIDNQIDAASINVNFRGAEAISGFNSNKWMIIQYCAYQCTEGPPVRCINENQDQLTPYVTLTAEGNTAVLTWPDILVRGFENNEVRYYEIYEYTNGEINEGNYQDIIFPDDCDEICEYRENSARTGKWYAVVSTIEYDNRGNLVENENVVGPFEPEETQCSRVDGTCKQSCSRGEYSSWQSCTPGINNEGPGGGLYVEGNICCLQIECGNNDKEQGEICDGTDLNEKTCITQGFSGGNLRCSNSCLSFDTSQCHKCGNGIIDNGEECDFSVNGNPIMPINLCSNLPNNIYISGTLGCYNPNSVNRCKYDKSNCESTRVVEQENCNNNIDDDEDGAIDCSDTNCWNTNACGENTFNNGCTDGTDNDHDGLVDSLDFHCPSQGLRITSIDLQEEDEFLQYSEIPIIECSYQISPDVNHRFVKDCVNLTLNEDNINKNMECSSKVSSQGFVEFRNCNVGSEIGEKTVKCEVKASCKGYPSLSQSIPLSVIEFDVCSESEDPELQKEQGENTFTIFEITEPRNSDSFNSGETINVEVQVKNRYITDDEVQSNINAKVELILVETNTFDELAKSTSESVEIEYLRTKTFNLEIQIPENTIENDNYRIYAKVYRDRHEDEICRSKSLAINVVGENNDDNSQCTDNDEDGFCEDEDCNDDNDIINSEMDEICTDGIDNNCDGITDFADESCIVPQERGEENNDFGGNNANIDEDNDGLPDDWEYSWFGNLLQGPSDDPDNDGITNLKERLDNTNPKISDNKKSSSSAITILLIVLGITIVVGIAILVIKKIKNKSIKRQSSEYNLNQENEEKIKGFIQEAKSKGMKKNDIKSILINAGWKEKDINKFL